MDDEDDDWFSEIPEEERVTDAEVARVVEPLLQDVRTTLVPDHHRVVGSNAQRLREFLPISSFEQQVVDDVQQESTTISSTPAGPRAPPSKPPALCIEMGLGGASRMRQSLLRWAYWNEGVGERTRVSRSLSFTRQFHQRGGWQDGPHPLQCVGVLQESVFR